MQYRRKSIHNKIDGFTLVELVVVMVLIGILSIAILPRFANTQSFSNRGFFDQLKSTVEFARKSAVAQRRNVCVNFAASVTVTQAIAPGAAAACTQALVDPSTGAAFNLAPPTGVAVASTTTPVTFGGLGTANTDTTVTVTGDVVRTFLIVANTGYVQ